MEPRIKVIQNLYNEFAEYLDHQCPDLSKMQEFEYDFEEQNLLTIGAEVEVRWRSFFPKLYDQFLKGTEYSELSKEDQTRMTELCQIAEVTLLPKLRATERAGIPRGADRYHEFAFKPCYNSVVLAFEIHTLRMLELIPTNMKHSLHITIGGMEQGFDSGMVLLALEIMGFSSKERIYQALDPDKFVAWGRRGHGGLREREKKDISLGKDVAVEFRTLELPTDETASKILIFLAWLLANTAKNPSSKTQWDDVCESLYATCQPFSLDITSNWGRPQDNRDLWSHYADNLDNLRVQATKTKLVQRINTLPRFYL